MKRKTTAESLPIYIDGVPHLKETDLLKYELEQLKVINGYQAIGLKKVEMERAQKDYEQRTKVLQLELAELTSRAKNLESSLRAFQENLGKSYGMDFSKVSYDDVTGKITKLEDDHG